MKIETYHKTYELLEQCVKEADSMNQAEVRDMLEDARQTLWKAWSRLQEMEQGAEE